MLKLNNKHDIKISQRLEKYGIRVLHLKITHFDSVASVFITSVVSVASCPQVSHLDYKCCKCHKSILPSCLCHPSNDITKTLKTPQRLVWKKRNHLTGGTSLLSLEKPLKN
jgi:hypothetical protein